MRRLAIMAAILLAAGTAPAARLCRDTKGLFTPCIGERPPAEHHRRQRDAASASAEQSMPGSVAVEAHAERRSAPSRPPLIAKARLCRDSKGLFTPCVR